MDLQVELVYRRHPSGANGSLSQTGLSRVTPRESFSHDVARGVALAVLALVRPLWWTTPSRLGLTIDHVAWLWGPKEDKRVRYDLRANTAHELVIL